MVGVLNGSPGGAAGPPSMPRKPPRPRPPAWYCGRGPALAGGADPLAMRGCVAGRSGCEKGMGPLSVSRRGSVGLGAERSEGAPGLTCCTVTGGTDVVLGGCVGVVMIIVNYRCVGCQSYLKVSEREAAFVCAHQVLLVRLNAIEHPVPAAGVVLAGAAGPAAVLRAALAYDIFAGAPVWSAPRCAIMHKEFVEQPAT